MGKPTINDVARIAGVSKKTVSRVINRSPLLGGETRRRVEAVIGELGYVPNPQARALALRRNFLIALVHDNPNAQMVMRAQAGILEALNETEFEMLVRPIDRRSPEMRDDLRRFLERQRPYGVVLMPPVSEDDAIAALCETLGCRFVRMGSAALDAPERLVASNDREAVRQAVASLLQRGHRRIALLAGPPGFRSSAERRMGYSDALSQAGVAPLPDLEVAGDYRFDSGLAAGERLLDLAQRPSAVFCCNDEMAAGLVHAAGRRGLAVPADLSVIGFDDTPVAAHIWPPLTTVRLPFSAMARSAARKLIGTGEGADEQWLFPAELVERGSVRSLA